MDDPNNNETIHESIHHESIHHDTLIDDEIKSMDFSHNKESMDKVGENKIIFLTSDEVVMTQENY